ncbi:MAG TPA: hypothetical protein VGK49_02765, partial [Ilumatobacteraceae bacterium]
HLEVRLDPEFDETDDTDDADDDAADEEGSALLDGVRLVEVTPAGRSWTGRWDRLVQALGPFRC